MTARAARVQSRIGGEPIRAPGALADHPKVIVNAVAITAAAEGVSTTRPPLDERRRCSAGTRDSVHE